MGAATEVAEGDSPVPVEGERYVAFRALEDEAAPDAVEEGGEAPAVTPY